MIYDFIHEISNQLQTHKINMYPPHPLAATTISEYDWNQIWITSINILLSQHELRPTLTIVEAMYSSRKSTLNFNICLIQYKNDTAWMRNNCESQSCKWSSEHRENLWFSLKHRHSLWPRAQYWACTEFDSLSWKQRLLDAVKPFLEFKFHKTNCDILGRYVEKFIELDVAAVVVMQ